MSPILIHPTHRKFVRLLRDSLDKGTPILLTRSDFKEFDKICQGEMTAVERHQKIYRLALRAKYRPFTDLPRTEKVAVVDTNAITFIEKRFAIAERKHLRMTLESAFILPLLQSLIRRINRRAIKNQMRNKTR